MPWRWSSGLLWVLESRVRFHAKIDNYISCRSLAGVAKTRYFFLNVAGCFTTRHSTRDRHYTATDSTLATSLSSIDIRILASWTRSCQAVSHPSSVLTQFHCSKRSCSIQHDRDAGLKFYYNCVLPILCHDNDPTSIM